METQNLEAFKNNKIRPSVSGLSDSKYPARDATLMLGITNPFFFEMPTYLGYDIRKLRDKARFLEVVINRNGVSNGICPLFFDGAVCSFTELPLPNDTDNLNRLYQYIERLRGTNTLMFTVNKHFNKKLASSKIKDYLCALFRINKGRS